MSANFWKKKNKNVIKKKMLEDKLKPGDVILVGKPSPIGFLIEKFTKGPYTHSALYIGDGNIIESAWNGVVMTTLDKYENYPYKTAMRHKTANKNLLQASIQWAYSQVGKGYDYLGLFGIANSLILRKDYNALDDKDKYWCSELIADAFIKSSIDVDFSPDTWKVSPNDFYRSNFMTEVDKK